MALGSSQLWLLLGSVNVFTVAWFQLMGWVSGLFFDKLCSSISQFLLLMAVCVLLSVCVCVCVCVCVHVRVYLYLPSWAGHLDLTCAGASSLTQGCSALVSSLGWAPSAEAIVAKGRGPQFLRGLFPVEYCSLAFWATHAFCHP